jgi:hypothetical protein
MKTPQLPRMEGEIREAECPVNEFKPLGKSLVYVNESAWSEQCGRIAHVANCYRASDVTLKLFALVRAMRFVYTESAKR